MSSGVVDGPDKSQKEIQTRFYSQIIRKTLVGFIYHWGDGYKE